jgi:hypothetical protein
VGLSLRLASGDIPRAHRPSARASSHESDIQSLRVFARKLRQKIEADPAQPQLLLTEQDGVSAAKIWAD